MMKTSILFLFLFVLVSLSSCSIYSNLRYGIKSKHPPKTVSGYLNKAKSNLELNDSIFYAPDRMLFHEFLINRIFRDSQFVYLGLFFNDSMYIASVPKPLNNACAGSIEKELDGLFINGNPSSLPLKKDVSLFHYKIKRMIDNIPITKVYFEKPVLVFLYSFQYGRYYKSLWKRILELIHRHGDIYKMMIISIDNGIQLNQ